MSIPKLLGRALAVLFAGVLALVFVPTPRANAASFTLVSAHTVVPVGETVTATYRCPVVGESCYIAARVADHPTETLTYAYSDSRGYVKIILNYDINTVRSWRWDVWGYTQWGQAIQLPSLFVYHTARITLLSAQGLAAPGQVVNARFAVGGVRAGSHAEIQHWTGSEFRTVKWTRMPTATEFTLPLTNGSGDAAGYYVFRAMVNYNGVNGYSNVIKLARGEVKLWSAPSLLRVGQTGTATGKIVFVSVPTSTGNLQVWHGGQWVTIRSATANSSGIFTVPLAYGVSSRGTYRFRLNFKLGKIVFNSPSWLLTRY